MKFQDFYKKNFILTAISIFIITQILFYFILYIQIGELFFIYRIFKKYVQN